MGWPRRKRGRAGEGCHLELVLIRHGRSTADDEGVIEGGGYDAPLSEEGRRQAQLLAVRLVREGYRFDVLFASPLRRAREVAEMVSAAVGSAVVFDDRLRELHTGAIAGLPAAEADRLNPRPPGGHRTYVPIPGGESTLDQYARVLRFYCELVDRHMDDRVCIVGHGGTLSHLLRIIYGLPMNSPRTGTGYCRFVSGDTAVSRLTINGPQDIVTHFLNDESHLRGAVPRGA